MDPKSCRPLVPYRTADTLPSALRFAAQAAPYRTNIRAIAQPFPAYASPSHDPRSTFVPQRTPRDFVDRIAGADAFRCALPGSTSRYVYRRLKAHVRHHLAPAGSRHRVLRARHAVLFCAFAMYSGFPPVTLTAAYLGACTFRSSGTTT